MIIFVQLMAHNFANLTLRLAVLLTVDQLQDTVDWLRMVMGDDQVEKVN